MSQPIEGHSASFASLTLEGATSPSTLFTFASKTAAGAKVHSRHLLPAPPAYRAHNARRCAARCAAWSWVPAAGYAAVACEALTAACVSVGTTWPERRLTLRGAAPPRAAPRHRGAAGHQGGGHGALRQEGDRHLLPARGGAGLSRRDADQQQVQHDLHGYQGAHRATCPDRVHPSLPRGMRHPSIHPPSLRHPFLPRTPPLPPPRAHTPLRRACARTPSTVHTAHPVASARGRACSSDTCTCTTSRRRRSST